MTAMPRARLYPVLFFETAVDLAFHAYEPDPRGGYRPVDLEHRGSFAFNCPHPGCGKPLVWDVSQDYLRRSHLQCPWCHKKSSGDPRAKGMIANA